MTPGPHEERDRLDADASKGPGPEAGDSPRWSWLGALAVVGVVLVVVAITLAMHVSPSGADPVLDISQPQAADRVPVADTGHTDGSSSSAQRAVAPPTPARVGHAAPSQVVAERPLTVTLASGTTMRVRVSATAASGELEIPKNINEAGWWDGGSRLGDPYGTIVVAAHVDSFTQGLGRFAELLGVRPGDMLHLSSAHLSQGFRVVDARLVPKTSISAASDVFSGKGPARLVLITCGGEYDPALGGYQSNQIVAAVPVGRLTPHR